MKMKNFEDAIKDLENLIQELEQGDLPLDEALKKFEEGIKLIKYCNKKLDEAEQKIELILKDEKEPKTVPFEEPETE
ncbi:MAG: exodeoxyribonuclease VII small subunit [Deltaproteobacteria bacterium]|nr:MAG: exodeoxyribonuclease VII small subunit [Deltaproteobacteria bacterium]